MASAQIDLLNMPSVMADRPGNINSEHVASSAFAPDANALREAALKSRRKKQAAKEQSTKVSNQQTTVMDTMQPPVHEDSPMRDAPAAPVVDSQMIDTPKHQGKSIDTEDGEIPESSQENTTSDVPSVEREARERTPRPPPTMSPQNTSSSGITDGSKHVRPGLNMTARDLDEAKHLILDLLGLGVTPEYLVDCGVSPQCLAICFYELNLRFPLNLDRRQINLPPFYDLDKHMKDSQRREQIIRQRDRGRLPPKHAFAATVTTEDAELPPRSESSPPLSPEPIEKTVVIETSPIVRPDMNIDSTSAVELTSPQSADIAQSSPKEMDTASMEDQKRMELLARKAAMDSINKKRAAKNTGLTPSGLEQSVSQPQPMEIKDAVDALVASVRMNSESSIQSEDRSSRERDDDSVSSEELLADYDSDAMVEDELETRSPSLSEPDTIDQPMDTPVLADTQRSSPEPILSHTPTLISSPKPPLSRVRFNAPDPVRSSSLPAQPTSVVVPVAARRSRPVASDFIDQAPPRPASASRTGSERMAPLKRKRSFVDPAVWPKRIVIDLDSSDDEDDQDEGAASGAAGSSSSSSKTGTDRAPSRTGSHDKPAGDQAAQMLLEKELQIKAMMQRIKMRELQKRKSASGSRTPVPVPGTPADPSKTPTTNAEPTSSPLALSVNLTPMVTPSSEVPPTIPTASLVSTSPKKDSYSALNDSIGTISLKVDKGEGKALEPQGTPQDHVTVTSVEQPDKETRINQLLNSNSEQASTHFKAYVSPLAGFTTPNLQRSSPTDQQLSAILWISSSAGQNVDRQLCMYEFPSGICKNEDCKDIHTRDFGASDDEIRRTARTMFPNARPENLTEIVARVRQSVQAN